MLRKNNKKCILLIIFLALFIVFIVLLSNIKFKKPSNSNEISSQKKEKYQALNADVTESSLPKWNFTYGKQAIAEMSKEDFWLNKISNKNKIIMSIDEIKAFNEVINKNIQNSRDIINISSAINGDLVKEYIGRYKIPSKLMVNSQGNYVTKDFYNEILSNRNMDHINEKMQIQYGIIKTKTSIRSFPTDNGVYDSKDSLDFDKFQETGISGLKPVAILNKSLDEKYLFILSNNYSGWVKCDDVFIISKDKLKEICYSENFIIVKSNYIVISVKAGNTKNYEYKLQMGTKIPLVSESSSEYVIELPIEEKGITKIIKASIKKCDSLYEGYLPYSKENIIKQAFSLLGENYDWGDKADGRDCSSFICSAFSCFGFEFPRNDTEQVQIPGKSTTLYNAECGDIIFMKGHVMLYLGKYNGDNFMIHSFTKYKEDGAIKSVKKVGITSCNIEQSNGKSYSRSFTKIIKVLNGD